MGNLGSPDQVTSTKFDQIPSGTISTRATKMLHAGSSLTSQNHLTGYLLRIGVNWDSIGALLTGILLLGHIWPKLTSSYPISTRIQPQIKNGSDSESYARALQDCTTSQTPISRVWGHSPLKKVVIHCLPTFYHSSVGHQHLTPPPAWPEGVRSACRAQIFAGGTL